MASRSLGAKTFDRRSAGEARQQKGNTAGFAVGYGIAAAEDAAGTIKTVFDSAVTAVTGALKKKPAEKTVKKASEKTPAKKAAKKAVSKETAKKTPAKRAAKKAAAKKAPANKAAKKAVKKPAKKAGRLRR
jgi:hypothetical protein